MQMDSVQTKPVWASWGLLLVLVLALGLRVIHLSGNPPELIADELDLYNSIQSYVHTGHDVDGSRHVFIQSETRFLEPPLYGVAAFASSLIFGNGPFGLRYAAVIFGVLAVALLYGIVLEITRRRALALAGAFIMALAPTFIHLSRIAWEPSSELPFLLGGIYCWLRAFRHNDNGHPAGLHEAVDEPLLVLGSGLLALCAYTYPAGWFHAIMLAGPILALNLTRLRSRENLLRLAMAGIVGAIILAPALWLWCSNDNPRSRFASISTFSNGLTPADCLQFAHNYLVHFRWSYLVTSGDPIPAITWRYLVDFGALYWWIIPLAILGLITAQRFVSARWMWPWLLWWLIVYPLGGSLTNEGAPHAPRTLGATPIFCILAALGIGYLWELITRITEPQRQRAVATLSAIAFVTAAITSVVSFERVYNTTFPTEFPDAWDSGVRSTFAVLRAHTSEYQRLCFSVRTASFEAPSYYRYYLADRTIPIFEPANTPTKLCKLPDTLLVSDTLPKQGGFHPIAAILDDGGEVFAIVSGNRSWHAPARKPQPEPHA